MSARTPRVAGPAVGLTPRLKNPLLLKDEVGRCKPSCYDLPDVSIPFGRPGNQDVESAGDVCMQWVTHLPSRSKEDAPLDFIKLHKKAAGAKVVTSRDLIQFRKEHEGDVLRHASGSQTARATSSQAGKTSGPAKALVPSDVIPNFTYGRKVRPSTPIDEVISNRFGEKAEHQVLQFNESFQEARAAKQAEVRKIPLTTASRGHASGPKKAARGQDSQKEVFKLSRFARTKAQVDTNRGRSAQQAHRQESEQIPWDPRPVEGLSNDWDDARAGRDPLSMPLEV